MVTAHEMFIVHCKTIFFILDTLIGKQLEPVSSGKQSEKCTDKQSWAAWEMSVDLSTTTGLQPTPKEFQKVLVSHFTISYYYCYFIHSLPAAF